MFKEVNTLHFMMKHEIGGGRTLNINSIHMYLFSSKICVKWQQLLIEILQKRNNRGPI